MHATEATTDPSAGGRNGPEPPKKVLPLSKTTTPSPYNHRNMCDFIKRLGRMFYDDASIVLLDFLVDERRALTESDIRERLRWRDALLNRTLLVLERHHLISREQRIDRGPKTPVYFRINPYVLYSSSWRHDMILRQLESDEVQAETREEFECTKCVRRVSALQAASGPRRLEDDHPLCERCGELLTVSKMREWKATIADRKKRVMVQLQEFNFSIERLKDMEVEVFDIFSRAEKNETKRQQAKSTPTLSSASSSSSVQPTSPSAAAGMSSSLPSDSKSSLGSISQSVAPSVYKPTLVNVAASTSRSEIGTALRPAGTAKKAAIPWFQNPTEVDANRDLKKQKKQSPSQFL